MKRLEGNAVPLEGTTLIEASAGTGKTYTIAMLFLRILLERRLDVSQILVVTYTRAATAELRDRIRRRLVEAVAAIDSGSKDEDLMTLFAARRQQGELAADRSRLLQAVRDFDQAAIFTIHAFCQQTLGEGAFESRTPFELELTEDQAPLLREVALDYWAHAVYGAERELVACLRSKQVDPERLAQLAAKAVRDPGMPVLPDRAPEPTLSRDAFERSRGAAAQIWRAERDSILALLCEAGLNRGSYPHEKLRGEWAAALDELGAMAVGKLPAWLYRLAPHELASKVNKGGRPPQHAFFGAVAAFCEAADALRAAFEGRVLGMRRGLVDYARAELPRRRHERGVYGFDDLLHQLGRALEGGSGEALAARVRERHPAALIDEFQDTDPVQYGIFRRIYDGHGSLFLIGDPKQAIYGFRGADVFAYMLAARLAGRSVYTLDVNYRSDPELLRALSALYGRAERPFLFREIQFEAVRPKPDAREHLTPIAPALQLLFVPRDARTNDKKINIGWGEDHLPRYVACEIAHLLQSGAELDHEPIAPRHVAVLCRTNAQSRETQRALAELGVPTVLEGDSSVFDSDTAEELSRVLWAIAEPADLRKLSAALASSIFGVDGAALHRMHGQEAGLETWLDRFARWNQLWHERGFVQMIHRLIDEAGVQPRLLTRTSGERKLTDLLHLIELLHQGSAQHHLGPLSLLHWFSQMRSDPEARVGLVAESEQMRLEHDEHAVRLTTVHRSKGLEYPIVFCPFMWKVIGGNDKDVRFHDRDDGDRVKLDLGSEAWDQHKRAAEREDLAESLRLLYVALTRAKHRCYVVWGRFNRSGASPLGYLLHPDPTGVAEPDAVEARLAALSDAQLRAELEALCSASEGSIGVRDLRFDAPARYVASERRSGPLNARSQRRTHAPWPRMTSFSRLTAEAAQGTAPDHATDAPDHDESVLQAAAAGLPASASGEAQVVMHAFPSGSRPGSLIHAVYEHIDFERGDPAELTVQAERFLALYGVDATLHRDALVRGLELSLGTPLDAGDPPLTLARIARSARVDELEFTLRTAAGGSGLSTERLAQAFARHAAPACDPGYAERLGALGFIAPAGFVKGFMDLVFRHEGRFYVADYKSNWLGERAADYLPARLVRSMREHHYFLQYHLYTLALHRWLAVRVPDYDYERHFGGVYYLYVRGMSAAHAPGTGVFFDRPPRALIEALADALGASEVRA
jgi:exodeoxyribonuclease V beta subunit